MKAAAGHFVFFNHRNTHIMSPPILEVAAMRNEITDDAVDSIGCL
jgi:hypothetical protein